MDPHGPARASARSTRTAMLQRLRSLPLVVLLAAAADSLWVRVQHPHREPEAALVGETLLLYAAYGLLALVPTTAGAWLWSRSLGRRWRGGALGPILRGRAGERFPAPERGSALAAGLWLAACLAFPLLAHARLDSYTGLGGDTSALAGPRPWLEVLGILLAVIAAADLAGRALARLRPWMAAAAPALLGLVGVIGGGLMGAGTGAAPAPPSAGDNRPNLLLLVWDTTRSQSLQHHGYDRETTPCLSRLAEESLVFDGARSASVFTLSSHVSMLTGVYPSHHRTSLARQVYRPHVAPSAVETLRRAGYRTGGFGGTDVLRAGTGMIHGFEHYDDRTDPPVTYTRGWAVLHDLQSVLAARFRSLHFNGLPHWIQDFQRPAAEVLDRAREWIQKKDDPRPWFCLVNLYDVHWPYRPSPEFEERWVDPYDGPMDGYLFRSDRYVKGYRPDERDNAHLAQLYDAEMSQMDREVDRFLAAIDVEGSNTAVLMTSDHGEAFGEGGCYEHQDVHEPQVCVPFLVRMPGAPPEARGRVDGLVSGVDVAPTLLGMAGLEPVAEGGALFAGRDLLAGRPEAERAVLVEDRDHLDPSAIRIALYRGPWKLVRAGVGEGAAFGLHDPREDPLDQRDRSAEHPEVFEALKAEMERMRGIWGADDERQEAGGGVNWDAMRALGYAGD